MKKFNVSYSGTASVWAADKDTAHDKVSARLRHSFKGRRFVRLTECRNRTEAVVLECRRLDAKTTPKTY